MDTREKIKKWEAVRTELCSGKWKIVVAFFDPLTSEHAECLHKMAQGEGRMLVIVKRDEYALLDENARAALVAALRDVTIVMVETAAHWRAVANSNPAVQIVENVARERNGREQFERYILERQAARDPQA